MTFMTIDKLIIKHECPHSDVYITTGVSKSTVSWRALASHAWSWGQVSKGVSEYITMTFFI